MSGAKRLASNLPQGTSEFGQAIQRFGDDFYQDMHSDALNEMRQTGDFSYLTSPWQAMKIGTAELIDGLTNNGNPKVSADRDAWFNRSLEHNKSVWQMMQDKKKP